MFAFIGVCTCVVLVVMLVGRVTKDNKDGVVDAKYSGVEEKGEMREAADKVVDGTVQASRVVAHEAQVQAGKAYRWLSDKYQEASK